MQRRAGASTVVSVLVVKLYNCTCREARKVVRLKIMSLYKKIIIDSFVK